MIKKEKQIIHLKEELHIIFLKRENNYTIKTKFDQYCNKFSIFETVKEVDEETVTKQDNISLSKDPTSSLLSGNVQYSYEINNSLIIEGYVTKKSIGRLKDDSVILLNDVEVLCMKNRQKNIWRNVNMNNQSVNEINGAV